MATFLLDPTGLDALAREEPLTETPELEVSDYEYDYSTSEGDGLWVPVFLRFLERRTRALGREPQFTFSNREGLCSEILEEIESPYIRGLLIRFCNENYEDWRDSDVDLPDYDDIHDACRSYCDGCDSGWHVEYGAYEGPMPEDVGEDEDAGEPDICEEERHARVLRNRERQRERDRREEARDDAEGEEIGREFVCDDDCDSFSERVCEAYRNEVSVGDGELDARWKRFLQKGRHGRFPRLHRAL